MTKNPAKPKKAAQPKRIRGGKNGPSKPSVVVREGSADVPLYDMHTIALQFGWSVKNARLYTKNGRFGKVRDIAGRYFVEKKIVDNFLPEPRGRARLE